MNRWFSLSVKIAIIISITLAITLSIIGAYLFDHYSSITMNNLVEVSRLQAESLSKDISNIFENAKIATNYLSQQSDIKTYLKEVSTKEDIRDHRFYTNVLDGLTNVAESNNRHFLTWIANEKANFYIDHYGNVSDENYDVNKRPWYKYAIDSTDIALTPPYVEWSTKEIVISSIKTLRDDVGIYGFVVVDIALSDLPAMLALMKQGDNDISYLITGDGTYIYAPDSNKIVNKNMFDSDDEFSLSKEIILDSNGRLNPIIYNERPYYLISHKVDERGWIIVTLVDSDRIDEEVHSKDFVVYSVLAISIILLFILVNLIIKVTTKPYRLLVSYGKDVANGNIDTNIPEKHLKRRDEMGALSNSFQDIINTFREINTTLEDEIIKKNIELESQFELILEQEKYASLGMIVTGIAHEINTPIGSCLSVSTYLLDRAEKLKCKFDSGQMTKDDFVEYNHIEYQSLDLINESLVQASNIIENFKMISVNHNLEKKHPFVLNEIFNTAVIGLNTEINRLNHQINIECDKELVLDSYPGALIQVITHLIMNSFKHGFKDKSNGFVNIRVDNNVDDIQIVYEDNGSGIKEENIDKIYEPFFTTSRGEGCSGLGMHVVYTLTTQKLNGTIRYEKPLVEGVKFIISINKRRS